MAKEALRNDMPELERRFTIIEKEFTRKRDAANIAFHRTDAGKPISPADYFDERPDGWEDRPE